MSTECWKLLKEQIRATAASRTETQACREKAAHMQNLRHPEHLFDSPVDTPFIAKHCSSPALYGCILLLLPYIVKEEEPVGPKESICLMAEVQVTIWEDSDLYWGFKVKKWNLKYFNLGFSYLFPKVALYPASKSNLLFSIASHKIF